MICLIQQAPVEYPPCAMGCTKPQRSKDESYIALNCEMPCVYFINDRVTTSF